MKILKLTFWIFVLVSIAAAQTPAGSETAPGVSVIKSDFVYASTDSRQEAEAAIMRGERVETGGGAGGGITPTTFRTFPYLWQASVDVKNVGQKTIKAISLEMVFLDSMSKSEILRYRLSRNKDFGPGETVTLKKLVNERNKGYYYAAKTNKKLVTPVPAAATRQVIITRVEYADGTVWRH